MATAQAKTNTQSKQRQNYKTRDSSMRAPTQRRFTVEEYYKNGGDGRVAS